MFAYTIIQLWKQILNSTFQNFKSKIMRSNYSQLAAVVVEISYPVFTFNLPLSLAPLILRLRLLNLLHLSHQRPNHSGLIFCQFHQVESSEYACNPV